MKYIVIVSILTIAVFTSCEKEDSVSEEIIVEKHPDKPENLIERITEHVFIERQCYVGRQFNIKGTLEARGVKTLLFEVNHKYVHKFWVDMTPLQDFLSCKDYYKTGKAYTLPIYIISITAPLLNAPLEIGEKPRMIFRVSARIVLTEALKKELLDAGCWKDKD